MTATLKNDTFLRACLRQPTDTTPVWLMRQAGRYLPEYRALKAQSSFLHMVRTPEVATEVTYTMMRAGAQRTSTPIYVTFGIETCMLHGRLSPDALRAGDLAVIDLTPTFITDPPKAFALGFMKPSPVWLP